MPPTVRLGLTILQFASMPSEGAPEFRTARSELVVCVSPNVRHDLPPAQREAAPAAAESRSNAPTERTLLVKSVYFGRRGGLLRPYRLRVPAGRYREPDVLNLTPEQDARAGEAFTEAAELVMEVVSPDDPDRDYITKRRDYAEAGAPEYWIIDRAVRQVLVLRLEAGQYLEHGRFGPGQHAASHRLPGFTVSVDDVLAQGQ